MRSNVKRLMGLIAFACVVCSWSAVSFGIDFQDRSGPIKSLDLSKEIALGKISPVTILEPHTKKKVTYIGSRLDDVLTFAFGSSWSEADDVLFICQDGYQAPVSKEKITKHRAWLVWARQDNQPFEVINTLQSNEQVKLGPYYLIWENLKDSKIKKLGATDFPYQVVGIKLTKFSDRYPGLVTNDSDSKEVKEGFQLFRTYCVSCHALNGQGGEKGPDLVKTKVFDRLSEKQLLTWILNPTQVKPGTLMPAFSKNEKNRKQKVKRILSYIKTKYGDLPSPKEPPHSSLK